MGTTANYSWPTPVATDLVKDGWEAIKDLGDAADTTVKAVSDAQGLVHINTTSFSAVASQSINDVFTSTYTNYRIHLDNLTSATANQDLFLRVRVSGSDLTSSSYYYQSIAGDNTTVSGLRLGTTLIRVGLIPQSGGTGTGSIVIDLQNPQTAAVTTSIAQNIAGLNTSIQSRYIVGYVANTNSYTGFTIAGESGHNISGNITVYGYRK